MSQKRNYKPKGYKPNAIDGDGDGFVQDGTEFERPVGTDLHFDEPEPTEPVFIETQTVDIHTVAEGENIQAVAAKYVPAGMTRQDYARKLYELNGDFFAGKVVRL
jgi:hypothetical protein